VSDSVRFLHFSANNMKKVAVAPRGIKIRWAGIKNDEKSYFWFKKVRKQ